MKIAHFIAENEYHDDHRPPSPEDGCPLSDLTGNGVYPDDVYEHPGWYASGSEEMDGFAKARMMRGKPKKAVQIFRSVPKNLKNAKINVGDWVTTSRTYAVEHGLSRFGTGKWKVLTKIVNAGELHTDGNSLAEWGYWPSNQEQLNEWADAPFQYTMTRTRRGGGLGEFTDTDRKFKVFFQMDELKGPDVKQVSIEFASYDRRGDFVFHQTGDAKHPLRVFSTVAEMLYDLMTDEIHAVTFAADLDEPSRVRLYARLAKQTSAKYPKLDKIGTQRAGGNMTYYVYDSSVLKDNYWDEPEEPTVSELDETVAGNVGGGVPVQIFKKGSPAPKKPKMVEDIQDPEVRDAYKFAKKHYASDNPEDAFKKYVLRGLKHAEKDDKRQDTEIDGLIDDVERLAREFEKFKKEGK